MFPHSCHTYYIYMIYVVPHLGIHTSIQPNDFRPGTNIYSFALFLVCLMIELIEVIPLIDNAFYWLDAFFNIFTTVYINNVYVSIFVCFCMCQRSVCSHIYAISSSLICPFCQMSTLRIYPFTHTAVCSACSDFCIILI